MKNFAILYKNIGLTLAILSFVFCADENSFKPLKEDELITLPKSQGYFEKDAEESKDINKKSFEYDALDSKNEQKINDDYENELKNTAIGSPPFYCNPLRYPPGFIFSIRACKPFLRQPWMLKGFEIKKWPIFLGK